MSYTSHYFLLALVVAAFAWVTTTFFLRVKTRSNMALRLQMNALGFCVALAAFVGVPVLLANLRLETIDIWIATMLIWCAAIACILLLSPVLRGALLVLVALTVPLILAMGVIVWEFMWLNNILLLAGILGALFCLLRGTKISRDGMLLLLAIGALIDVLVVWVVPAPPRLSQTDPKLFTLIFTVGRLSLGAIDMLALALLSQILMPHSYGIKRVFWAAFIGLTVLFVMTLDAAGVFISRSFPFLLAILPFAYIGVALKGLRRKLPETQV